MLPFFVFVLFVYYDADERYVEEQNRSYISKWLRNSIKQYNGFDEAVNNLRTFFLETKVR